MGVYHKVISKVKMHDLSNGRLPSPLFTNNKIIQLGGS
jgi:hypothetical protein